MSNNRHVVPRYGKDKRRRWAVSKGGAKRVSAIYDSKGEAVKRAQTIVKNLGGDFVYIHGVDGRIHFRIEV